jgi:hypothetical protein
MGGMPAQPPMHAHYAPVHPQPGAYPPYGQPVPAHPYQQPMQPVGVPQQMQQPPAPTGAPAASTGGMDLNALPEQQRVYLRFMTLLTMIPVGGRNAVVANVGRADFSVAARTAPASHASKVAVCALINFTVIDSKLW